MLTGLDENIAASETAPLVLSFERAGDVELVANIVAATDQMGGGAADARANPAADQGSHSAE